MKTTSLKRKLTTLRNFRTTHLPTLFAVALATMFLAASHSQAQTLQTGDILVPVGQSTIQVYDHDTFASEGTIGPHPTGSATTGDVMVRVDNEPLLALFDANNVAWWNNMRVPKPPFGNVPYDSQPNSFACNANPYVYVGQEGGTGDVLKFNADGNFITRYDVPTDVRGSVWIDVADPVLWYVTGPGRIKRYNMMTGNLPPMADYGVGLINDPEEFKIIPSGPFQGQVIVADPPFLKRLSGPDGTTVEAVYLTPGDQTYPVGVALDPDGLFVWAADRVSGDVLKYFIDSGGTITEPATAVDTFPTFQPLEVSGLAIDGERTVCRNMAPPPSLTEGRMTGGGSVFTPTAVRVTHGFTLRCDITKRPNQLTVHWPDNKFKLAAVTAVSCTDNPTITPAPPRTGFDTHDGTGTGELNGVSGAMISWTFTDAGEPGTFDRCRIEIRNQLNVLVLVVDGPLQSGNHQAHK